MNQQNHRQSKCMNERNLFLCGRRIIVRSLKGFYYLFLTRILPGGWGYRKREGERKRERKREREREKERERERRNKNMRNAKPFPREGIEGRKNAWVVIFSLDLWEHADQTERVAHKIIHANLCIRFGLGFPPALTHISIGWILKRESVQFKGINFSLQVFFLYRKG